jgi:hypothetical protein
MEAFMFRRESSPREQIAIAVGTAGLVLVGYPSVAAVSAAAYLLASGVIEP